MRVVYDGLVTVVNDRMTVACMRVINNRKYAGRVGKIGRRRRVCATNSNVIITYGGEWANTVGRQLRHVLEVWY